MHTDLASLARFNFIYSLFDSIGVGMKYWILGPTLTLAAVSQLAVAHSPSGGHPQQITTTLAGGASHEDCLRVEKGHQVEYRFASTVPVEFSIHYHDNGQQGHTDATYIVSPAMFESSPAKARFTSDAFRVVCFVWKNKDKKALELTYHHSMHPPEH